jgi:hypothetical protein
MYKVTFAAQGFIELEVEMRDEARIVHEALNKAGLYNVVIMSKIEEFPAETK